MGTERNYRIFIGLGEVAGYYSNLSKGLHNLGCKVDFFCLAEHKYKYDVGTPNGYVMVLRWFRCRIRSAPRFSVLNWLVWVPVYGLLSLLLLVWSLTRYDVFIMGAESRFLPKCLELPLLKLARKRVIWIFHGTDSRPPYLNGIFAELSPKQLYQETKKKYKFVRWVDRWADVVIEHPPTSHFHSRKLVRWLSIGIPFSPVGNRHPSDLNKLASRTIVVLHAPSRPNEKGSQEIREAIEYLNQAEFLDIQLVEIINKSNHEVLDAISECMFVVDEVYSDTLMAGLASEAAWFGKPTIVAGYEIDKVRDDTISEIRPPVMNVRPEFLIDAIRRLALDRNLVNDLGNRAENFVHERWAPEVVAQRFIALVEGNFPEDWLFDPYAQRFLHGWGMHNDTRNNVVKNFVSTFGTRALYLEDKPKLRDRLLASVGMTLQG